MTTMATCDMRHAFAEFGLTQDDNTQITAEMEAGSTDDVRARVRHSQSGASLPQQNQPSSAAFDAARYTRVVAPFGSRLRHEVCQKYIVCFKKRGRLALSEKTLGYEQLAAAMRG